MCSIWWKRVSVLVIGILDMLVAGSLYSFNIYAPSLQLAFNFTQEDIDTIPSFGHLGFCVGVPAGVLHFKCGSMWMSVVGFLVSTTGYLLIWSAFLSKFAYHYKAWLMSFYYFVLGHGLVYLYMEALITNMKNLPKRHRGTVIGFLDAIFGASGSFFIIIYKSAFSGAFWTSDEQNLIGFILFLAATCGFAGIISVLGLREYKTPRRPSIISQLPSMPDVREYTASAYEYPRNDSISTIATEDEEEDDLVPIVGTRPRLRFLVDRRQVNDQPSTEPRSGTPDSEDEANTNRANVMGLELFKSLRFHCLIWPFILTGGVCFVVITNIEYVLKSFHLGDYVSTCIVVAAISNGLTRILCGIITDRLVDRIPRINVLFLTMTPLLVVSGFIIFYMDEAFCLVLWSVSLGIAFGALWCLVPTIISESYGMRYFGLNWGCTLLASALFSLCLQRLFGYLYDMHVPSGSLFCDGVQCFRLSFIVFVSLVGVSIVLVGTLSRLTDRGD